MKYYDTRVLERCTIRIFMSEDADTIPSRKELLSHLLSKVSELSRDEPIIAANINEQLQHMGLSTWSLSTIRRIRDTVYRVNPKSILEVGAAIGHRTAWLLDLFEQHNQPDRFDIVEQGNKFAVIIKRLVDRYDASSWTNIVVGEFSTLSAESIAWKAATISGLKAGESPLAQSYDVIIVDEKLSNLASYMENSMQLLSKNGILLTTEPPVPSGEVDESDKEMMAMVDGFNAWIELIKNSQNDYHIAFCPVFEGTIVAFLPK